MQVLIISDKSDESELGSAVKQAFTRLANENGILCKNYDVHKDNMHYCVGCFSCWVKTPGICLYNDISRDINREYVHSDVVLILSPLRYGCYSTTIRRVLDRVLPNILPFFQTISGEVHHAPRYEKYPAFVTVGYGTDVTAEEADTFRTLSDANAMNFQAGRAKAYVCREESDMADIIHSIETFIKEGVH